MSLGGWPPSREGSERRPGPGAGLQKLDPGLQAAAPAPGDRSAASVVGRPRPSATVPSRTVARLRPDPASPPDDGLPAASAPDSPTRSEARSLPDQPLPRRVSP